MGRFHHHHRHRHHFHRVRVEFSIDGVFAVELNPNGVTHMAISIDVGQSADFVLTYLDQNGQVMSPAPVPDQAPAWGNTTPAAETLTVSATDDTRASSIGVAAGTDTVEVDLAVGGVKFKATVDVTVNAVVPKQVLTSIAIEATPRPTA
jgi:hypothetical protein